jgi:hypothetical protein
VLSSRSRRGRQQRPTVPPASDVEFRNEALRVARMYADIIEMTNLALGR